MRPHSVQTAAFRAVCRGKAPAKGHQYPFGGLNFQTAGLAGWNSEPTSPRRRGVLRWPHLRGRQIRERPPRSAWKAR